MANVEFESLLGNIQGGLKEFFSPETNNSRKAQIEAALNEIKNRDDVLQLALFLIDRSNNSLTIWFACEVLSDHAIPLKWPSLPIATRKEYRIVFCNYAFSKFISVEPFVRKRLLKVIVDIAKQDWPLNYPEFFVQIKELSSSSAKVDERVAGMTLLLLAIEEFVLVSKESNHRDRILSNRRSEIASSLSANLPIIAEIVKMNLQEQLAQQNNSYKAQSEILNLSFEILLASCNAFPLPEFLDEQLVDLCFKYVLLWKQSSFHVSALCCINEILEKRYIPKKGSFDVFISNVASFGLQILKSLCDLDPETVLKYGDEEFLSQVTRFVNIFLSYHIQRVEKSSTFPLEQFLTILNKFTFNLQLSADGLERCLECWTALANHLESATDGQASRYMNTFETVMNNYLEKILFRSNQELLTELHEEACETLEEQSNATETVLPDEKSLVEEDRLDEFISKTIELIVRLAHTPNADTAPCYQLLISKAFGLLQMQLQRLSQGFSQTSPLEKGLVYDCGTLLLIISKIAPTLATPQRLSGSAAGALQLITWTLEIISVCNAKRLYTIGPEYVRLQMDSFHAIRSMSYWMEATRASLEQGANLGVDSLRSTSQLVELEEAILTHCIKSLNDPVSPRPVSIVLAAIGAINAYSGVGTDLFFQTAPIRQLMGELSTLSMSLPIKAAAKLHIALSNAMLKPLGKNIQLLDSIARSYNEAFQFHNISLDQMSASITTSRTDSMVFNVAQRSRKHFVILRELSRSVVSSTSAEKKACAQLMVLSLRPCIQLLTAFLEQSQGTKASNRFTSGILTGAREAFDFVVEVFHSMLNHIDRGDAERIVSILAEFIAKQDISRILIDFGKGGVMLIHKVIKLLNVIIADARAFDTLSDDILEMILNKLVAVLKHDISSESSVLVDIHEAYYSLIHLLLRSRWKWFFEGVGVRMDKQKANFRSEKRKRCFVQSMEILLESLQDHSLPPSSYRANILVFDDLNRTHNLYSVELFNNAMLPKFSETLLLILIQNQHQLLENDLLSTIYGLAATDFERFFADVIPRVAPQQYLNLKSFQTLRSDRTAPGFCRSLRDFAIDVNVLA